jgi:hypothetical protein
MMQRCTNPKHVGFHNYGGRGIRVCERWRVFENFLSDMGERPTGTSLERTNNSGDYEPGNCVWATPEQQTTNRRVNRIVEFCGRRMTLSQWAKEVGVSREALAERLERWPIEKALTAPKMASGPARSQSIVIEWNGVRLPLTGWARRIGTSVTTISRRLRGGWSIERIVTTPPRRTQAIVSAPAEPSKSTVNVSPLESVRSEP